jgi:hypothetical protein
MLILSIIAAVNMATVVAALVYNRRLVKAAREAGSTRLPEDYSGPGALVFLALFGWMVVVILASCGAFILFEKLNDRVSRALYNHRKRTEERLLSR